MIFDTHAHYTDEQFDTDRDELLSSMQNNGVGLIMNAASNLDEMTDIIKLIEKYPFMYAAVGIHPEAVTSIPTDYTDKMRQYATHKKIKAIGEIGLDYHWTTETKDLQQRIFGEQIELAKELKLPIIVHDREAHGDTLRILKEHHAEVCGGVFHCYSGSAEMVREITEELGMYVAFGGTLTFKNAVKPREAAKVVPQDKLLIETDSPYLAPTPYRGKRNSSLYLPHVVSILAEIRNTTSVEIERITEENGRKLFNITE